MSIVEEVSDLDDLERVGLRWLIPSMYRAVRAAHLSCGRNDVAVVMIVDDDDDDWSAESYHAPTSAAADALWGVFALPYVIGGNRAIENLWSGTPDPGHAWVIVVHGIQVLSILLKLDDELETLAMVN